MKLKINKCPKCGESDVVELSSGTASCTLGYELDENGVGKSIGAGSDWDWNKQNKYTRVECSNCHMCLNKYVVKEDF